MIEFIFPGEECHSRRGNDRDIVLERIETKKDSESKGRARTLNPVRGSTLNLHISDS